MADEEPAKPARTDPLTPATRNTKRNLLIVAVATVTYRAFDITIDKIPVAGAVITFDRGVFEFLLSVVLCYFLISFLLYYYIDIKNFPSSPHQDDTEVWRRQRLLSIIKRTEEEALKLSQKIDEHFHVAVANNRYMQLVHKWTDDLPSALTLGYRLLKEPINHDALVRVLKLYKRGSETRTDGVDKPSTDQEAFRVAVVARLSSLTHKTLLRYFLRTLASAHLVWRVRLVYAARNYAIDGALPILLAAFALLALYELLPVQWVQFLSPRYVTGRP